MGQEEKLERALNEVVEGMSSKKDRAELLGSGGLGLWLEVEEVEEGYMKGELKRGGEMERVHLMVVEGEHKVLAGAFSNVYQAGATQDAATMEEAKRGAVWNLAHGSLRNEGLGMLLERRAEEARGRVEQLKEEKRNAERSLPSAELDLAGANTAVAWLESLEEVEAPSLPD